MNQAVQNLSSERRAFQLKGWSEKISLKREIRSLIFAFCLLPFAFCLCFAQQGPFRSPDRTPIPAQSVPPALKDIGIDQKLDSQVPLDLKFRDEQGKTVQLGDYFGKKPVVLALVYYTCPMLCNQVLNGLTGTMKTLSFTVGDEFEVVTVSFDPKEVPETAAVKKQNYLDRYERKGEAREKAAAGWHFLTGDEPSIQALTEAVGFKYRWDEQTQQYIHASGIMVLTPRGKLSRYLYGIDYAPIDLKLSLVEASEGKIGSPVEQIFLFCYHYDPVTGKYSLVVINIIRLMGLVTFVGLALIIYIFRRRRAARERKLAMSQLLAIIPIGNWLPFAPEQASSVSGEMDMLYLFLVVLTVFFGVTISLTIVYFAIKYRRRNANEYPEPIEGSLKLESLWIIIPLIIAMGIFWWGALLYFKIYRNPSDPLDVYIVGKQWMWKAEHPSGQREINELHVPVGRRVQLTLGSEDVIHSFFIPAFRVKTDVVPGRFTHVWWEPTQPGKYDIFCAEYCGTNHSRMVGTVIVQEPAEYDAWLSGNTSGGSPVSNGEKLFSQLSCNTCHKPDKTGRGPSLEGKFGTIETLQDGQTVKIDENYVRESILTPRAKVVAGFDPVMPTFQGLVSEEQLLELVAYVKSLGEKGGGQQGGSTPAAAQPSPSTTGSSTQKAPGTTQPTPAKQEAKKK